MSLFHNTTKSSSDHHLLEHQLEALKASVAKLVERSHVRGYADRATATIQEHPFAAVGIALGLGYVTARIVRWRT